MEEYVSEDPVSFFNETVLKEVPHLDRGKYRMSNIQFDLKHIGRSGWGALDDRASIYAFPDLRKAYPNPQEFAEKRIEEVRKSVEHRFEYYRQSLQRQKEYDNITSNTIEMRKQVEEVVDAKIKSNLLAATKKIEDSLSDIKRIEEHEHKLNMMKADFDGMRKLIGVSQEFQDWKVLASEVEGLKKTQVAKDIFNSEVKRVDQALEGLNRRLDDLKAIKFWSKRTIVEIVLAIIAVIASLYAAGVF